MTVDADRGARRESVRGRPRAASARGEQPLAAAPGGPPPASRAGAPKTRAPPARPRPRGRVERWPLPPSRARKALTLSPPRRPPSRPPSTPATTPYLTWPPSALWLRRRPPPRCGLGRGGGRGMQARAAAQAPTSLAGALRLVWCFFAHQRRSPGWRPGNPGASAPCAGVPARALFPLYAVPPARAPGALLACHSSPATLAALRTGRRRGQRTPCGRRGRARDMGARSGRARRRPDETGAPPAGPQN